MYNSISKICPKFQFLNSQSQVFWGQWAAAARWECGKHFEKREYFISNLCCMRCYVLNKSLLSTILAYLVWLNFVLPILEHFCPLFVQIAETHSFCPDGVSFCPDYHHQPLIFTQQPQTPFRDMYVHKKNTPTPPQNTPFPDSNLKVGKMNYPLGKSDPNWAKCLKRGQKFKKWANLFYSCILSGDSGLGIWLDQSENEDPSGKKWVQRCEI